MCLEGFRVSVLKTKFLSFPFPLALLCLPELKARSSESVGWGRSGRQYAGGAGREVVAPAAY